MPELPFLDEHRVPTPAPAAAVWKSLSDALAARRPGAGVFARLVGAEPARASGNPPEEGSALPGFEVAETVPSRRIRLTGRHYFSRYSLVFVLEPHDGGTTLSALSYGEFPGLPGRVYRALVIGTGAHALLVPRLLRGICRRAERAA